MSQLLNLSLSLTSMNSVSVQVTQATVGVHYDEQAIATSDTAVDLSGVTTPRYVVLENLDADNYVQVGPDATGRKDCVKLLPGEVAVFPLDAGVALKAKANTAGIQLGVTVYET